MKKKRPVIDRRQSSQTSQSSLESPARAPDAPSVAVNPSSVGKTPPAISERPAAHSEQPSESIFQEYFSPSIRPPSSSAVSYRKRHSGKSGDFNRASPRQATPPARRGQTEDTQEDAGGPGPSNGLRPIEHRLTRVEDLSPEELGELRLQRILLEEANARLNEVRGDGLSHSTIHEGFQTLHSSLQSKSDGKHESAMMSGLRLLNHDAKSTASLAQTLIGATGELDLGEAGDKPQLAPAMTAGKGKGRDPDEQQQAEMFAKRAVQPAIGIMSPSATDTSGSLARSKSQLTFLLERDRTRSGDFKAGHYEKGDRWSRKE